MDKSVSNQGDTSKSTSNKEDMKEESQFSGMSHKSTKSDAGMLLAQYNNKILGCLKYLVKEKQELLDMIHLEETERLLLQGEPIELFRLPSTRTVIKFASRV